MTQTTQTTPPAPADTMFLNHVELLHRPGEGDLAVLFFKTLGCVIEDLTKVFGATRQILGVFAGGGAERDPLNKVLYLTEFRNPEKQLDAVLAKVSEGELRSALDTHDAIRYRPGDVAHFGLRYPSIEELHEVIERLQSQLPAPLQNRVRVIPSTGIPLPSLGIEAHQGFVHTDVVGTGLFPFGQLIELQAQRPLAA